MITTADIQADMEVAGSNGKHAGKVGHMGGAEAIKLARQDSKAGWCLGKFPDRFPIGAKRHEPGATEWRNNIAAPG